MIARSVRIAALTAVGTTAIAWIAVLLVTPAASAATIYAGPGAASINYLTPNVSMKAGEPLSFTNYDTVGHDVTARETFQPKAKAKPRPKGKRRKPRPPALPQPLFKSAIIGFGETAPVTGTERLTPGHAYDFYCSIHPSMKGKLTVR